MNRLCFWTPLTSFSSRPPVAIGKFVVHPQIHRTDSGAFQAGVTVSSGRGAGSHHRIFRFPRLFEQPEAAQMVALTQGWLQTCSPRAVLG